MIALVSSEWLRVRSRRLVKVLVLLALLGIVVAVVIGGALSHRPGADELTRAERQADRVLQDCLAQDGFGAVEPGGDVEAFCAEQADPSLFLSRQPLRLSELPETLRGTAFVAILIGLVIGASAVGASWQSGTITTILTWEPRRTRVALVRAAVVAAATFGIIAVLLCALVALLWIATSLRGLTETPPGWSRELSGVVLRVSALASAASIIGGAIAMLGRNTAAALGGVFVYLAVFEGIVRGLRPSLSRVLLGDNIATVVIGSDLVIGDRTLTPASSALVVAVYTFGLLAVATASFRARDVQ